MATDKDSKKTITSTEKKDVENDSLKTAEKQTRLDREYRDILKEAKPDSIKNEKKADEKKGKKTLENENIPIIPSLTPTMPLTPTTPPFIPPINGADKAAGVSSPITPDIEMSKQSSLRQNTGASKATEREKELAAQEKKKQAEIIASKDASVSTVKNASESIQTKKDNAANLNKSSSQVKSNNTTSSTIPFAQPDLSQASKSSGTSSSSVSAASAKSGGQPPKKKEYGGMIFFWIIVLGVAALLIGIGIGGGNSLANATTEIKGSSAIRVGQTEVYTAQISNDRATFGDDVNVIWTVGGKTVKQAKATDKDAFTFSYSPKTTGNVEIAVKVGDYANLAKARKVTVNKPLLSITMDSHKITYGDKTPEYTYKIEGFIDNDTAETLNIDVVGGVQGGITKAGSYNVTNLSAIRNEKYDVVINTGKVEVSPRVVKIADDTIYKVYDGKDVCDNCDVTFENLVNDDELKLSGRLNFTDKNVGTKNVSLSNVKLSGSAAANYTLADTKTVKGVIVAKELVLTNLEAADKIYDGTTNVTFDMVGQLEGIVDGDSVAVGSITARFENSAVGDNKKIIIEEIKLAGKDAANYTVKITADITANIKGIGSAK